MRMRLTKTRWLVIILATLSAAGLLGRWYVHERHEHDQHAGHDHAQHADKKEPAAAPAKIETAPADHDHSKHTGTKEPEAPVPGQVKLTPEAVQQAKIETAPVVLGPLNNRALFTGELVFNEERLAKIHSRVPGRVVQIVADYGQMVKPGEVLAIIDSVELGQAQMGSRQAAAKFNAAQKAHDRARQLYEGKAISRAELQERQARLEVERADLDYAQNRLRLLGAGGIAPASLPKGARSGAIFALRSPIAGRVVDRKVTPGLVVKEDEELFTVADTSALWCFVQIPEKDLPLVNAGSQAIITVSSLSREEFPGAVDYLADMVDKATRTVRARVRVDNPGNRLKAGMFANIAVRVGQRTVLSVPETAVLSANGELFVFVEMAPGIYQKHLVKTGVKGGGRVEVLEGLDADEPVVVQGGFTLKSEVEKGAFQGCGLGGGHGHAH
ncbi:MAG: efflux RND transporter periplasmic adaptor subunit [Deltaproteobacteria bacterium]|nr:efflux RND transporter periplasmic adaptor subunit [Deltaproteobacteria bacterium]